MFEQISSKFQAVIKTLRGEGRLTEAHVDAALKELRMALLEADVHFGVVRDFISSVRERPSVRMFWRRSPRRSKFSESCGTK